VFFGDDGSDAFSWETVSHKDNTAVIEVADKSTAVGRPSKNKFERLAEKTHATKYFACG
jgi:hypothetical protein